jgi:outer membrane protein
MNTRNLSLILNVVLLLAVAHLYYLNLSKKSHAVVMPGSPEGGVKIAYINIDTLNAKYEWLRQQEESLQQRAESAEKSLRSRQEAFMRDVEAFQKRAASQTVAPAQLQKEQGNLERRQQQLAAEEQRLGQQFAEEKQKANTEMWAQIESKLKSLQSQIGYDYILGYVRGGGQVLLANDSLEITNQVLELLNTNPPEAPADTSANK